ncbi:class I SAM-dependent methyltransferase [Streptomyces sp. CA-111067]|uniref:class I SAM-dependent methyltransferase n=1 Tax=Streptomyces sp. CA-111067 TaxID=3240046 RepID=UPI003D963F86
MPSPEATTDRQLLVTSAYRDDSHLSARQALYRAQEPRHDLPLIAVELLSEVTGTVVDVGCGNGTYVHALRHARPDLDVVGMDLSPGMAQQVTGARAVADASRLPLAADSVDALMAMHMLYHLPDVPAALAEMRRVLKPGGCLLVSTNSTADKAELQEIWQAAQARTGQAASKRRAGHSDGDGERDGGDGGRLSFSAGFPLESAAAVLGGAFDEVAEHRLPSVIRLDSAEPALRYFASYFPMLRAGPQQLADLAEVLREEVERRLRAGGGELRVHCLTGLFLCR